MLVVANWKMNGVKTEAKALIEAIKAKYSSNNEVVICPPFTLLQYVSDLLKSSNMLAGAQNCSRKDNGAFTGDISANMIKDCGAKYVILGHSERRRYHNERDELIRSKAEAVISAGLTPIICIGETLEQRKEGKTKDVVESQMEACLPKTAGFVVAYEPVWAIGSGVTPANQEIEEIHKLISKKLNGIKILYGGSVNDSNCAEIAKIPNVSGFLVGGASLDATKFIKIMNV